MDSQEIKEKFQQLLDDYHANRIDWKTFEQQLFELKSLRLGISSSSESDATERFPASSQTALHSQTASQVFPSRFSSAAVSKSGRFSLQSPPETSLPLSPESPQNVNETPPNTSTLPLFSTNPNIPYNPNIPNNPNNPRRNVAQSTSTFFPDADSPSRIFRSTGPLQTSRRNSRLDPGTRLGKNYTLQRVLGIGQCGETWLAEEKITGNLVVLKLVPALIQKDENVLDLVTDSFRRSLKLKYPGICPLFRLAQDEILGSFFVSAFVDALPLDKYYERYRQLHQDFPFEVAVQLLIPVSQALDFAHRKKITHRMLKPQNILVGKRCGVVITDFAFTETVHKELSRYNVITSAASTASWKAPEIWSDQHYSPHSDQFALGVLACQLLTGSLPFPGENDTECCNKILYTEPVLKESLSEQTRLILIKVLSKNSEDRFSNCYEFARKLSESLELNPAEQTPKSGIWHFHLSEEETILDPPNLSKQQKQTFPYAKKPKSFSITELIPYHLISSRNGLIAALLATLLVIIGTVFWVFSPVSKDSHKTLPETSQHSDSTEKNSNKNSSHSNSGNQRRSENRLPVVNQQPIQIPSAELARYIQLAENGDKEAQRRLGEIYFYGRGVKPDYQKAIQYFQLSANQGDAPSLYHIGRCYELGLGVPQRDTTQAISIYKQAKTFPPAAEALKRLKAE
jgi:serine/threonine protein kinase